MHDTHAALDRLRALLGEIPGALVAFSGGVDSTLLLSVAHEIIPERIVAATARGLLFPSFEIDDAIAFCRERKIRHEILEINQIAEPDIEANAPDRCYLCKQMMMGKLRTLAQQLDLEVVLEGGHADDADDFRPGQRALTELGIRSPLREAGLTKPMIRELSRERSLPHWDRMSCTCYASRFPYGTPITEPDVQRVAQVEQALRDAGFTVYRARHYGLEVRLELAREEMTKLFSANVLATVQQVAREAGYRKLTLDLEGYRTGSLNESLAPGIVEKWKQES